MQQQQPSVVILALAPTCVFQAKGNTFWWQTFWAKALTNDVYKQRVEYKPFQPRTQWPAVAWKTSRPSQPLQGEGRAPALTQAVHVQHVGDAAVTHVHFRLVLLPTLLYQLFQRLGHDLYQTTTTEHVGGGRRAREQNGENSAGRSRLPPGPGKWASTGEVRMQAGGWGGAGKEGERAQHPSHPAEARKAKCSAAHTHLRGRHLTGCTGKCRCPRGAFREWEMRSTPVKVQPNRGRAGADAPRRRTRGRPTQARAGPFPN